MELYPDYLRPNITSAKFGQTKDRCYLEIVSTEVVGGYLHNETITRTDLGFISDDVDSEMTLFFNPENSLLQSSNKFVNEFDEISIINCTDLFSEESSTEIYDAWNKNRSCPS